MRNPGALCFPCQDKESEKLTTDDSPTYDVQDMARILRLEDEQVRRLARKGKLPPRVPVVRKWLWPREIVEQWIKSEGRLPQESALEIAALAALADVQYGLGDPVVMFPVASDGSRLRPVICTYSISQHPESP